MSRLGNSLQCLAAAILLVGAGEPQQVTSTTPPEVKTIVVNDYPMAYVERGAGPVLVLVHGAASDYRTWRDQLASLSSRFRVVAVSLRHYYPERWDGQGGSFSEEQHARDLAVFLDRLGGGAVHLLGHSRGAHVAIFTARMRPELVRKLVLMEPALTALDPTAYKRADDPRVIRWTKTEKIFKTEGVDAGLEYFIDDINGPGSWKRFTEDRRQRLRDNAWTITAQLKDTITISCADVASLKMPVMLANGEKTTRQFIEILDATHKCLPSAQRTTIPGASHGMHLDNPGAVDAMLLKFLAD